MHMAYSPQTLYEKYPLPKAPSPEKTERIWKIIKFSLLTLHCARKADNLKMKPGTLFHDEQVSKMFVPYNCPLNNDIEMWLFPPICSFSISALVQLRPTEQFLVERRATRQTGSRFWFPLGLFRDFPGTGPVHRRRRIPHRRHQSEPGHEPEFRNSA